MYKILPWYPDDIYEIYSSDKIFKMYRGWGVFFIPANSAARTSISLQFKICIPGENIGVKNVLQI